MFSNKKLRIGIDVDGVVVRSDVAMLFWLIERCGYPTLPLPLPGQGLVEYNLCHYFKDQLNKLGIDGMDFWRSSTCYDNMVPVLAAKVIIDCWHNQGHEIVFVSQIKGDHNKSKYYFLKNYFPYMAGYIATKEKWLADVDVLIDDRLKNFEKVRPETTCVYLDLGHTQDSDGKGRTVYHAKNWNDIERIVSYL